VVSRLEPLGLRHATALERVASDPRVAIPAGIASPLRAGWAIEFCLNRLYEVGCGSALAYAVMMDERVVGCAGLYDLNRDLGSTELSIWLSVERWRLGVGRAVTGAMLALAFAQLGLERVNARCSPANVRGRKFLEHLGFGYDDAWIRPEGHAVRDAALGMCLSRRK
jgi:RimJ/RimL family protein N-acetyltransferase